MVSGGGPNLLARDLITMLGVDLDNLKQIRLTNPLQELLDKYEPVFSDKLGCYNGPPVTLRISANAEPRFYKAKSVPLRPN